MDTYPVEIRGYRFWREMGGGGGLEGFKGAHCCGRLLLKCPQVCTCFFCLFIFVALFFSCINTYAS